MEYFGESNKLTRILSDERLRVRQYGRSRSNRIRARLEEFEFADTLVDISHLPPARLHQLRGDLKNQFAVDVGVNWRLVFEGYDRKDQLSVLPSEIVTISIIAIEDYH